MKKTLKDTYVYKVLGLDPTVAACSKINGSLNDYAITGEQLEGILNEIKYKINFPSKVRLMDDLKSGSIVLVNAHEAAAIPAWLMGDGHGGIKAAVVNVFGKIRDKDGVMQFNVREVFALAQIGMTIKEFYLKEERILSNLAISKLAAAVYERMMYRVLDTLYSLDIGPMWLRSAVKLELRAFFAMYLLEKGPNDSFLLHLAQDALKATGQTAQSILSNTDTRHHGETDVHGVPLRYTSLPLLMEYLAQLNPLLKDLDITAFLRKFMMMYGEKALLMAESYSYFLAMVMSVTVTGNVVKDFALETVIGREGVQLYTNYVGLTAH